MIEFIGELAGLAGNVLTGGFFGGLLRLVPELLKLFQARGDREHEYRMAELQWKVAREGGEQRIREAEAAGAVAVEAGQVQAYVEALKAQAIRTGVAWADALNVTVRPLVTYYFLVLFGLAKLLAASAIVAGWAHADDDAIAMLLDASRAMWGPAEEVMLSGLLNFWFVGRVFDKRAGRA